MECLHEQRKVGGVLSLDFFFLKICLSFLTYIFFTKKGNSRENRDRKDIVSGQQTYVHIGKVIIKIIIIEHNMVLLCD